MGEAMNEQFSEEEMLHQLRAEEVTPEAAPDLSARIWAGISPQLQPYSRPQRAWRRLLWGKPVLAMATSALVILSFVAGRIWEKAQESKSAAVRSGALAQSTADRILLTAAADHLARSERFLVELQMAKESSPALVQTAGELLNDNRLYKQSAEYANDGAMADVLDRLGRVLAEVVHGERSADAGPVFAEDDRRLDGLVRAIRAEQRRSPVRV